MYQIATVNSYTPTCCFVSGLDADPLPHGLARVLETNAQVVATVLGFSNHLDLVSLVSVFGLQKESRIFTTSAAHKCPKAFVYHSGMWPLKSALHM